MVFCAHTVVVYVHRGWGGGLLNMGTGHCFSVQFSGELTYTVVIYVMLWLGGGSPGRYGALKGVFQCFY